MGERILEVKNINKSFSGIQVLYDINIDLYAGEILCLVGENGAGKSTIIKILSGAEKPDSGIIKLFGKEYDKLEPKQAINLGISTIYQDVDLVDSLNVADNIFLGMEKKINKVFVDSKQQIKMARNILNNLNIKVDPTVLVEDLSLGQKQSLQIVKALYRDAKILILDEPTASLGEDEVVALMTLVKKLADDGIGIIYISHYLEEVFEIGTRAHIIKDGSSVRTHHLSECKMEELIRDMVGRDASNYYEREHFDIKDGGLEVINYSKKDIIEKVSFMARRGEIFGIGGIVGAGRTELIRMIYGANEKDEGTLILDGKVITPKSPRDAINKNICLISEDRKEEGLFSIRSVKENLAIAVNEPKLFINLLNESKMIDRCINELNIKVFNHDHEVGKLSGGNQQKVIISRWLLMDAEVYIFDEPTKGVDIGAREEIYKLMVELVRKNKIIIMISSNMPELISMSDRIGIMRDGELVDIIDSKEATEDNLLKRFIGI